VTFSSKYCVAPYLVLELKEKYREFAVEWVSKNKVYKLSGIVPVRNYYREKWGR
jgi:hypothetical protein